MSSASNLKVKKSQKSWAVIGGEYVRSDGRAKVLPNPQLVGMLDYHYLSEDGEWKINGSYVWGVNYLGKKKSNRLVLKEIVESERLVLRHIKKYYSKKTDK